MEHACGKYSAQRDSHQAELRREETSTDQKLFNISSLQTGYLNLDSSSGSSRNSEIVNTVQTKCTFFGGNNHSAGNNFKRIRQENEKSCAVGASDNRQTEQTPRKCFRCEFGDHLIAKFPKPPKDDEKRRKQLHFNEKCNRACDNSKNNSDQKIYVSMARISDNEKCPGRNFGDSSQLTNWIFDS